MNFLLTANKIGTKVLPMMSNEIAGGGFSESPTPSVCLPVRSSDDSEDD